MSKSKISMKLLIDKTKNKVLFAEAGKECVDFLFRILTLPLATIVRFVAIESMAGSIGSLYASLENLGTDYVQEGLNKDMLLNSNQPSCSNVPLLTIDNKIDLDNSSNANKSINGRVTSHYTCKKHFNYSDVPGTRCPDCRLSMIRELKYVGPTSKTETNESSFGGGYVKGKMTYMITDDLCVHPISMISSIALLNKVGVKDLTELEEMDVTLDNNLGVALLRASLMSKTVLTDVFLGDEALATN